MFDVKVISVDVLANVVTPEVSIDTTGDEVKDQRNAARCIVLVPENRAYVIGEADEPIEAIYTTRDNRQEYTHWNISLLNTQVHCLHLLFPLSVFLKLDDSIGVFESSRSVHAASHISRI